MLWKNDMDNYVIMINNVVLLSWKTKWVLHFVDNSQLVIKIYKHYEGFKKDDMGKKLTNGPMNMQVGRNDIKLRAIVLSV